MTTDAAQAMSGSAPTVDLVYDVDCPNVDEARHVLRHALAETGFPPVWREWPRDAADTPPALRGLGSPTILVDGNDVSADATPASGHERPNSCRIYHYGHTLSGAPPLDVVTAALTEARGRMGRPSSHVAHRERGARRA